MGRKYLWGTKEARKRYRANNKDKNAAYQRAYYEAHKEERRAYMKAYRERRLKEGNLCYSFTPEYQRAYYQKNKETIKEKRKTYYKEIKEKLEPIVTNTATFDLSFESSLKNISDMYNSLLKKHIELQKQYDSLSKLTKEKEELCSELFKKVNSLNQQLSETNEWKSKIKRFFNL